MLFIILLIFGAIDILSGASIIYYNLFSSIAFYLMVFLFIKGLASVIGSLASGYYYDWMGYVDVISAIVLYLISAGITHQIFYFLGMVMMIKGIYSFGRSLIGI